MRVFKKLLVGIVALAVLAVTGSGLWLWQGLKTLETPVVLDEPTLFSVEPGTACQIRSVHIPAAQGIRQAFAKKYGAVSLVHERSIVSRISENQHKLTFSRNS